ncbi:MAG: PqqD family protein [Clostridia bacterium]|nr:PqqD family protein [Clostridia bacterium]
MKIKSGFVLRQVGEQYAVVPVGVQTVDFRCVITLNETGGFLWQQLQEETTPEAVAQALLAEYEVSPETAAADVATFVERLRENRLLDE